MRPIPKRRVAITLTAVAALSACIFVAVYATQHGGVRESFAATARSAEHAPISPSSEWPTAGGDLSTQRYSTATQLTTGNVAKLKLAFTAPLDPPGTEGGSARPDNPIEANGVIYAASSSEDAAIGAYDAATGKALWQKTASELHIPHPETHGTRGEAVGGGKVYVEESGGYLVAVNEKTGAFEWKALINTQHVHENTEDVPVYFDGRVFTGLSGADIVGGQKGFIKAFSATTGKLLWRFNVIPKLNEPAAKSWGTKKSRPLELSDGGGAMWGYATIDPKLGLAYFPTGNTWPAFGRLKGNDRYTDSLVALDLKTGKLRWYFQTTRHDEWDYDCTQPAVLWNHKVLGKSVDGISIGCKNGYVYELNRRTGKFVTPVKYEPLWNAKNKALKAEDEHRFHWNLSNGKPLTEPIPVGAGSVVPHCANRKLWPKKAPNGKPYEFSCAYTYYGTKRFTAGWNFIGLDFEPAAYDPRSGHMYYCTDEGINAILVENPKARQTESANIYPQIYDRHGKELYGPHQPRTGLITALNVANNKRVWQIHNKSGVECAGGLADTATGLLFAEDGDHLYAYDDKTGKKLWSYTSKGLLIGGPPIVYSVNGTEYVAAAVTAEGKAAIIAFSLTGTGGSNTAPPTTEGGNETTAKAEPNGKAIFTANCGSCHTLGAAGTHGSAGPNLDELKPNEETVEKQVTNGGEKMPSFKGVLSPDEIKSVAKFVSEVAGKG